MNQSTIELDDEQAKNPISVFLNVFHGQICGVGLCNNSRGMEMLLSFLCVCVSAS